MRLDEVQQLTDWGSKYTCGGYVFMDFPRQCWHLWNGRHWSGLWELKHGRHISINHGLERRGFGHCTSTLGRWKNALKMIQRKNTCLQTDFNIILHLSIQWPTAAIFSHKPRHIALPPASSKILQPSTRSHLHPHHLQMPNQIQVGWLPEAPE